MSKAFFLSAACGILLSGLAATHAGAANGAGVVRIDNGENRLTLNGQPALAVRAWRENYNAHGFDMVTFYVRARDGAGESLHLVPLFGSETGNGKEQDEVIVNGGADCLLRDFRLVQENAKAPTRLIVAKREFGDSFVSPGTVHFTYYDLARNSDGVPGWPSVYFKAGKTVDSKKAYCDVNDAFDKELNLGHTSGKGGPGQS